MRPTRDPVPDTKDWTWVLDRPCPECGYRADAIPRDRLGARIRANADLWAPLLADPAASQRPDPGTWSPAEYACHVRDVHRVFGERLRLMLTQDEPTFADWDQDATALDGGYAEQHAAQVAPELLEAAYAVASAYDAVPDSGPGAWGRRGQRGNGSGFTVESLGRYHLHDVVHHAWDVRAAAAAATVRAYDAEPGQYAAATTDVTEVVRARLDALAAALGRGARVLEIGSGGGRDAAYLEGRGVIVRRTDVSAGFVAVLREQGHRADVVDPLVDDLEGPYDGVWTNACLLHVDRADLPIVLARVASATRVGGILMASVKEGDGEGWSTHGSVAGARRFVYWREPTLREVLTRAGWRVEEVATNPGLRGERWLMVRATREA